MTRWTCHILCCWTHSDLLWRSKRFCRDQSRNACRPNMTQWRSLVSAVKHSWHLSASRHVKRRDVLMQCTLSRWHDSGSPWKSKKFDSRLHRKPLNRSSPKFAWVITPEASTRMQINVIIRLLTTWILFLYITIHVTYILTVNRSFLLVYRLKCYSFSRAA